MTEEVSAMNAGTLLGEKYSIQVVSKMFEDLKKIIFLKFDIFS